jgi:hypothetical protein
MTKPIIHIELPPATKEKLQEHIEKFPVALLAVNWEIVFWYDKMRRLINELKS